MVIFTAIYIVSHISFVPRCILMYSKYFFHSTRRRKCYLRKCFDLISWVHRKVTPIFVWKPSISILNGRMKCWAPPRAMFKYFVRSTCTGNLKQLANIKLRSLSLTHTMQIKWTLVDVMCWFYDAFSGYVQFNHINLNSVTWNECRHSVEKLICFGPQFVFNSFYISVAAVAVSPLTSASTFDFMIKIWMMPKDILNNSHMK